MQSCSEKSFILLFFHYKISLLSAGFENKILEPHLSRHQRHPCVKSCGTQPLPGDSSSSGISSNSNSSSKSHNWQDRNKWQPELVVRFADWVRPENENQDLFFRDKYIEIKNIYLSIRTIYFYRSIWAYLLALSTVGLFFAAFSQHKHDINTAGFIVPCT